MENYNYLIRRKVFKLFGAAFHIYDAQERLIGYSKQKAFKLKEDIRVYSDESMSSEYILIKARQIIDFSACYDVFDSETGRLLGTWQRKGFRSLIRDNWLLFDDNGKQIGEVKEDSMLAALFRRFISALLPQTYSLTYLNNGEVATYAQCFNPFVFKLKVAISSANSLDPLLILAGGVLLAAIEGRQR